MQASSRTQADRVVILATGGTIAGTATHAVEALDYRAAQLSIGELLEGVPGLAEKSIDSEQLARIDSKDMSHAVWRALVERVVWHLARTDVAGIVVTHGARCVRRAGRGGGARAWGARCTQDPYVPARCLRLR
jgi:L-asparaginase/Glu-tRNA(Gln) amidotransferase subunit D